MVKVETRKTRIQFAGHITIQDVESHRHEVGGWIVRHNDGRIFWFCHNYTASEIFNDIRGSFDLY